ncbi:putative Histidine kinase [uncultured Desulfobacterium sp.]|uniref:histidine kinase n=1 Tax=uncultured Desulfobacterium sp. TaxID=201089 RepID=A0A445MRA3_9BACT|nr:putative Histidine kinase [uncultured Desulfobacterium sp.]
MDKNSQRHTGKDETVSIGGSALIPADTAAEEVTSSSTIAFRKAKDHIGIRVGEMTAELEQANSTLKKEFVDRRRPDEAVKNERKRFYDVLETMPAYLVLLTPDYHVPFANRFFRERFGESHGQRCFEYLFGRNEPCETCETYTVLKTMTPNEWEWTGPDGRCYYVYDFPFTDTDSSTLIMEMGIDITDRKRTEEELLIYKEHLEEMVRERTAELESKNLQLAAEIAERKQTEDALLRAKEEWERTFSSVPDMIAILDDQHRILRANPAMSRRLGCGADKCVGLPCYSVVHGTDAPPAFCPHTRTLADGKGYTAEVHEDRLGGYFLVSTTPILDEQGRMMGSVHVARDITERKLVEKQLREGEDDLNRAQAIANIGSWRLNIQKNELLWSEEAHRIFGVPKGTSLTYETFLGVVHPDDRAYVNRTWNAALSGRPYDIEHRIVVGDEIKWVRERAELEWGKDGKLLGGFGTSQDVTEKKQSEQTLLKNQERFRLLSETAGQLLTTMDPQRIVNELCIKVMTHLDCDVFFNFLADENTGRLRLNACAGIPEEEVRKIEWLDYGVAVCGCVARDGLPMVAEDIFHNPNPLTELVRSYGIQAYACNPLMMQDRLLGTLSFGTRTRTYFSPDDLALMKTVTDQVAIAMERIKLLEELRTSRDELEIRVKERTAELLKTNEALEKSNRDLEDFAHVSSHDLQEPLRKIQTFSNMLITGYQELLDDKACDFLKRMQRAAERMQDLITDLLKYSRVRTRPEPFTMVGLKDSAVESVTDLNIMCEETQAEILIDDLPLIEADPVQMRQLFQNLFGNALKYHGKHAPVIRVYSVQSPFDGFCEVHVKDNGIGFDEKYLDKIFDPFQRLHGQSSPYSGTGMGLAICRRIVERHGGSITARSLPGEGSTFIVRLPVRQESEK